MLQMQHGTVSTIRELLASILSIDPSFPSSSVSIYFGLKRMEFVRLVQEGRQNEAMELARTVLGKCIGNLIFSLIFLLATLCTKNSELQTQFKDMTLLLLFPDINNNKSPISPSSQNATDKLAQRFKSWKEVLSHS
jgi:hypothetical protein